VLHEVHKLLLKIKALKEHSHAQFGKQITCFPGPKWYHLAEKLSPADVAPNVGTKDVI